MGEAVQRSGRIAISIWFARGPAWVRAAALLAPVLLAAWGCSRRPPEPQASVSPPVVAEAAVPPLAGGPDPAESSGQPVELAEAAQPPAPADDTAATPSAAAAEPAAEGASELAAAGMSDPLRPINRRLFQADRAVNDFVVDKTPVMKVIGHTPGPARAGIYNAFQNLDEPRTAANQLLQRKPGQALRAAARFVINSTAGIAGLFDVARKLGLKRTDANFGQTLASYGVKPGAYVYVPLAGPSNVRDLVGTAVDSYLWPLHWLSLGELPKRAMGLARAGLTGGAPGEAGAAHDPTTGQPINERYVAARQAYEEKRRLASATPAPVPSQASGASVQVSSGGGGQPSRARSGPAIIASNR